MGLLVLCLGACATEPKVIIKTEYKQIDCPEVVICQDKEYTFKTNEDLVLAYADTKHELRQCLVSLNTLQQCINSSKIVVEEKQKQ